MKSSDLRSKRTSVVVGVSAKLTEYLKKNKKGINVLIFVIALVSSIPMFWISFHNIDLIHNYSLIYSDSNKQLCDCEDGFSDIRKLRDCNGFQCPTSSEIYISSINMLFISHFIMLGIITYFVVEKWFEK